MQKIEFSVASGLEFVDEFSPDTRVLHSTLLTIHDVLLFIGRPFDGVLGWEASAQDIEVLKDAGYLK